jgi:hypothetical protein
MRADRLKHQRLICSELQPYATVSVVANGRRVRKWVLPAGIAPTAFEYSLVEAGRAARSYDYVSYHDIVSDESQWNYNHTTEQWTFKT